MHTYIPACVHAQTQKHCTTTLKMGLFDAFKNALSNEDLGTVRVGVIYIYKYVYVYICV